MLAYFNNMELKERIRELLEYSGKNISDFSRFVGFKTPQAVRELIKGNTKTLSEIARNKILSSFPEVNIDWLLTGEGEMLRSDEVIEFSAPSSIELNEVNRHLKDEKAVLVPLINIDSVGGIHSENRITTSEQYVERMIPLPDARPGDVAIMQSGNSMAPTIPAGAILQIRQVEGWREYFGYGNDFVLWLDDDRRITKQVLKYIPDPQNYVTCHSYNPESADEELPKSMIKEVWKVVNVLINKGW